MTVSSTVVSEVVESEWLEPIRRAARARFEHTGFPAARDEEWRFTPVAPIAQETWRPAAGIGSGVSVAASELASFLFGHPEWATLVFVNGVYHAGLSTASAAGVRIGSLDEALRADDPLLRAHLAQHAPIAGSPFTGLNTMAMQEGAVVHVPAGVRL